MFREMRRKNQQLPEDECVRILERQTSGTLALSGDNGYPYAVPLSFVHTEGKIFFHCAKSGHKLDALRRCEKVSFCVIDRDTVIAENFTTYFKSVIVFGRIRVIEDENEIRSAITALSDKYCPVSREARDKEIADSMDRLCMLELKIEHMTGKEAIELTRERSHKE